MLIRNHAAAITVRLLGRGEDAFAETRRALQHFAYACNFDNVYTNGNNHK